MIIPAPSGGSTLVLDEDAATDLPVPARGRNCDRERRELAAGSSACPVQDHERTLGKEPASAVGSGVGSAVGSTVAVGDASLPCRAIGAELKS